jgi:hypothetical protein
MSESNSSKMNSNSWTITVQVFVEILTILEAELGSSQNIELVASCVTFTTP